jgi:SnoaL-like protein
MSQENVELHYRFVDAFNRRSLDAVLALTDTEVEAVPLMASLEGSFQGHDGVRRWWQNLLDAFPDFTAEIVGVRALGDFTLGAVHMRGHGAGSQTPLDQQTWQVIRWRHGKCIWRGTFATRAEALEAVDLSEQDAHADS